jgi:hypothetical protein
MDESIFSSKPPLRWNGVWTTALLMCFFLQYANVHFAWFSEVHSACYGVCPVHSGPLFRLLTFLQRRKRIVPPQESRRLALVYLATCHVHRVDLRLPLVSHQLIVAQRFMSGLHTVTGHSSNRLAQRPFFIFWFMSQVARFVVPYIAPNNVECQRISSTRALSLWQCDNTLTVALDVSKAFLAPID